MAASQKQFDLLLCGVTGFTGRLAAEHLLTKAYDIRWARGKGEGPRENWEKGQVLRICRGDGVVTSRVIRDEYRI